jgi:hypothetical protein
MAGEGRLTLEGLCTSLCQQLQPDSQEYKPYFLIMLPGSATVTVHSLPFVGWKTAVGFDVSTVGGAATAGFGIDTPFCIALASDWRFRF